MSSSQAPREAHYRGYAEGSDNPFRRGGSRGRGGGGGGRGGRGRGRRRNPQNQRGSRQNGEQQDESGRHVKEDTRDDTLISECDDEHCPVCLNRIKIFAVGTCNHHICSECSVRLRVLCEIKECPICRREMPKVFHLQQRKRYEEVEQNPYKMDRKYNTCFENDAIQKAFERLQEFRCPKCEDKVFPTLKKLEQHLSREHELFFCSLCLEHVKLFPHERRVYNRSGLATHKRKGDSDDTSYKGHPLCEFCNRRYMDSEELFKHLRRDHFFCHLCDADGKQIFFGELPEIRNHFDQDHFLCTEDDCGHEILTAVFRTELDLKAHKFKKHGSGFSRTERKQNRIVGIDVNYARPRENMERRRRGYDGSPEQRDVFQNERIDKRDYAEPNFSEENFPSLVSDSSRAPIPTSASSGNLARQVRMKSGFNVGYQSWSTNNLGASQDEDFPSLPGASSASQRPISGGARPKINQRDVAKAGQDDFPSLGGVAKTLPSFKQGKNAPDANSTTWSTAALFSKESDPSKSQTAISSPKVPRKENGMTVLKKQPKLNKQDFPDLAISGKEGKNSELNQNQGELQGRSSSNLESAADLLSDLHSKKENIQPKKQDLQIEKKNSYNKPKEMGKNSNQSSEDASNLSWKSVIANPEPAPKTRVVKPPSSSKIATDDFPSLGGTTKKISAEFSKASANQNSSSASAWLNPALNGSTQRSNHKSSAPGLPVSSRIAANFKNPKPPPGLSSKRNYYYQNPRNFDHRNSNLLTMLTVLFGGGKSLEFKQFKNISKQFRAGEITCAIFYKKCKELIDDSSFAEVFAELLALLPDIKRQKELLSVHERESPNVNLQLASCSVCGQVLQLDDFDQHASSHDMDSDFPAL